MQQKCDGGFEGKVFELAILFARMWEAAETLETLPNRKQEAEELRDEIRKGLVQREKELKERNAI